MAAWKLPADVKHWIAAMAQPLHARLAARLLPLFVGLLFASGRRTVAAWLRAGQLGPKFRLYYYFLGSLGRKVEWVAAVLLRRAVAVVAPADERLLFALDDTPTPRYGPKVQGAGIHHNPTPGPAAQTFLYGHVWVTLAWVVRHPLWHTIGLPLRALLYVRQDDCAQLPARLGVTFRTKLDMAVALIRWLAQRLPGRALWLVADGAYAKRPVFQAARAAGVVLVSRLRKDARLLSLPPTPRPGAAKKAGRPRLYGTERISLAKRAGHRQGWQTATFTLYGQARPTTYKTFLATYRPAGGVIRVVIVKETNGAWRAYCCTDPAATVAQVLEAVADRAAIEQDFHDVKEVHGAGAQQVRRYWTNVAVYHLNLWLHTLIELWAWRQPAAVLCDRSASPWDAAPRRPSHQDRRNALRRQCLQQAIPATCGQPSAARKLRALVARVLRLVA